MKRVTLLVSDVESVGMARWLIMPGETKGLRVHGRHVLRVEDADAQDFAPPAPPTAGSILTATELDALPVGSVVDATVAGVRGRFMRCQSGYWSDEQAEAPDTRRSELRDAMLVTSAPIAPAPAKPLPTEPGERFWGKMPDSEPQWWFVRSATGDYWYLPTTGVAVWPQDVAGCGLVRLPEPSATEVTA